MITVQNFYIRLLYTIVISCYTYQSPGTIRRASLLDASRVTTPPDGGLSYRGDLVTTLPSFFKSRNWKQKIFCKQPERILHDQGTGRANLSFI
jgi:hypothetical protein